LSNFFGSLLDNFNGLISNQVEGFIGFINNDFSFCNLSIEFFDSGVEFFNDIFGSLGNQQVIKNINLTFKLMLGSGCLIESNFFFFSE
jgi:hypothetical protein